MTAEAACDPFRPDYPVVIEMTERSASAVVPFRNSDEFRERNLAATLDNLSACNLFGEILVVEELAGEPWAPARVDSTVRHLAIEADGPFNKSRLVNAGYRAARFDRLLVCDADMIIERIALERALRALDAGMEMVRPWRHVIDLSAEDSAYYAKHGELPEGVRDSYPLDRQGVGEQVCLAGGMFAITKDLFRAVGGMDERFRGWGGEDDAFAIKVMARTRRHAIARDELAWHLWHPRSVDPAAYPANLEILAEYHDTGSADYARMIAGQVALLDREPG